MVWLAGSSDPFCPIIGGKVIDIGVVGVEGAGGRDGVFEARCCVFDGVLDLGGPHDDDDDGCGGGGGDHDDDDVEHLGWAPSPANTAIVLPTHTGKRGALRRLFQYLCVCVF